MNVAVCIAPVTNPESVAFDVESESIQGGAVLGNPLDWVALAGAEQFLRHADTGDLIAVSVGGTDAEQVLEEALIRGADRAVRIAVTGEADDPARIAQALAEGVANLTCDLVLCGARSLDYGSETVGIALAARLDRPGVSRVVELEPLGADRVRATWKVDGGQREIYTVPLPAVISVEDELAEPEYVPVMSQKYRDGLNKVVEVVHVDLGADPRKLELLYVQAKPRTKHTAAPTSYIGAVDADVGAPSAMLEYSEPTAAARFLDQLNQWV